MLEENVTAVVSGSSPSLNNAYSFWLWIGTGQVTFREYLLVLLDLF